MSTILWGVNCQNSSVNAQYCGFRSWNNSPSCIIVESWSIFNWQYIVNLIVNCDNLLTVEYIQSPKVNVQLNVHLFCHLLWLPGQMSTSDCQNHIWPKIIFDQLSTTSNTMIIFVTTRLRRTWSTPSSMCSRWRTEWAGSWSRWPSSSPSSSLLRCCVFRKVFFNSYQKAWERQSLPNNDLSHTFWK